MERSSLTLAFSEPQLEKVADQAKTSKKTIKFKNIRQNLRRITVMGDKPVYRFTHLVSYFRSYCLAQTAKNLVKPGSGILAVDETPRQIDCQLKEINLAQSNLNRFKLHDLYLGGSLPLDHFLSGVLMRAETISQDMLRGKKLLYMIRDHHLKLGIRMDRGVVPLAGTDREYTTCGLDELYNGCKNAKKFGAEFTLWRCVYTVSDTSPSRLVIEENSRTLARFAVTCQRVGLVPIVSVDVLPRGDYDEDQASASLKEILVGLVKALADHHVYLEGTLVRLTAATPGICYSKNVCDVRVATNTAEALKQCLPPALPGIFLARTETYSRSLSILNEMQNRPMKKPFLMSFCFSRVILGDVIAIWAGQDKNLNRARQELVRRLECCSLATFGQSSGAHKTMFIKEECDAY